MNLQKYLDETITCEVTGSCRRCKYTGLLNRVHTNPCLHVLYNCPKCGSINAVVNLVTEQAADGTSIIIFERRIK